ncbi:MAG: ABC transporter permease [Saprospiraceae bacterium]|nr:ABC transporter permease [Saprospiraceae bacterium]
MNKIWLIVKREYLTRVRSRAFLLGTLLTPLAFGAFFLIQALMIGYKGGEKQHIVVLDEGGFLTKGIPDEQGVQFTKAAPGQTLETLKQAVRDKQYDGVLKLPALSNTAVKKQTIYFFSDDRLSPDVNNLIERRVAARIRDYKIAASGLDPKALENLETEVSLDPEPIDKPDDAGNALTSGVAVGISFFLGIIMYMVVLIYGSIVMRSVMEEKTNRIVEVIMSSVKPFQLMLGKIIGSAGVGTTQMIIWAILNALIFIAVQSFMGIDAAASSTAGLPEGASAIDPNDANAMFAQIMEEVGKQNWWYIIISSILFFIGGYFLYASMFAAIGSAVGDDMGEGQSLTFPIMIPIILAFIIMTSVVMRSPNSSLSVFASIFPLFSPIVMPGRLAFDPPWWQVALSIILLFATAILFVWIAGRIYRVGILMYGKKVTFKEIGRWMFYR